MLDYDCMLELAEHSGMSIQELLNGESMERG